MHHIITKNLVILITGKSLVQRTSTLPQVGRKLTANLLVENSVTNVKANKTTCQRGIPPLTFKSDFLVGIMKKNINAVYSQFIVVMTFTGIYLGIFSGSEAVLEKRFELLLKLIIADELVNANVFLWAFPIPVLLLGKFLTTDNPQLMIFGLAFKDGLIELHSSFRISIQQLSAIIFSITILAVYYHSNTIESLEFIKLSVLGVFFLFFAVLLKYQNDHISSEVNP